MFSHIQVVSSGGGRKMDSSGIIPDVIDTSLEGLVWDVEDNALYTLFMVDPDSINREFLRWQVINIAGNKIAEDQTIAEYRGSGPPEGSFLHRYVFLVFKQPGKIQSRVRTKTRDNLGEPFAGNFYHAQYDEYVRILKSQMIN
ncbi:PREDICTED: protein D2-like [Bactrocera latifrons]|uniref:protein D2-like n=1 Tax=Bactrocera latifrons TaxID=174628 RepID=UPI0008DD2A3D|nr:PREDICTED: protein D2-like [Bactrocera latifrons]